VDTTPAEKPATDSTSEGAILSPEGLPSIGGTTRGMMLEKGNSRERREEEKKRVTG
jgi:hypothetical protein